MTWLSAADGWAGTQAQVKQAGVIAWGTANTNLVAMIGKVLNVGLSLLGIVFLLFALYAGFKWMTARGDQKAVAYAKDSVRNNVIGLIIIVSAYVLTNFIVGQLGTIATGTASLIEGDMQIHSRQNIA